ncbi:hypothetical protein EDC01DRAFT_776507 [Geopyxis carbonaria]|nr:hypothetical protein EDC01DRAFT_776507 [Geopyxis carbonaria]
MELTHLTTSVSNILHFPLVFLAALLFSISFGVYMVAMICTRREPERYSAPPPRYRHRDAKTELA